MNKQELYECGICYFQGISKDFTPSTISANFNALECPKCLNNDLDSFDKVGKEFKLTTQTQAIHHQQDRAA
jgi:hypothetical protein